MNYLTKRITKIFLLDFFTNEERARDEFEVTKPLEKVFMEYGIPFETMNISSREDVLIKLALIRDSELGNGSIIHFLGHGSYSETGFGNNSYFIEWHEIARILAEINQRCSNGLIINSTCMCYGTGIFSILSEPERPFFAAIGSIGTSSLQAWMHNKQIYTKCLDRDLAQHWLQVINNGLEEADNGQRYVLMFS
jgi:hypothetical protein